ncbi:hypothetical protein EXIGLDRAFT_725754 [Exidia glandulosa HHB12029]|uniref:F-box domain-containing protein n=1 Tax=Exidia glandulosa HHB12029 TaxID=1314781 RepID=A0A165Q9Y1_EXIGL|nr:hypothetical protein EXIGLDRAFT_725754 [Exidia glandulosa HHB12029]
MDTSLPPACERTPEEVWNVVHAFVADYALDTHLSVPWRHDEPRDQLRDIMSSSDLLDRLHQSRRDVLSVMRVCKSWRDLALPHLHTTLAFSTQSSVELLADHLEASRKVRKHGLGWYTREVLVFLPSYTDSEGLRDRTARSLTRVVRCCRRLETYVTYAAGMLAEPREVMLAIPDTLRHLHWISSGPGFGSWSQVLSRAHGLRTLGMTTLYAPSDALESPPPDLSNLHSLVLNGGAPGSDGLFKALATWDLPALRAVSISMPFWPRSSATTLEFLERHGAQVQSLCVPGGLGMRGNVVERILQLCPNITTLSFTPNHRYAQGVTPRPAHANVTSVGIRSAFDNMAGVRVDTIPLWTEVFEHFDAVRFPRLRQLRMTTITEGLLKHDSGADEAGGRGARYRARGWTRTSTAGRSAMAFVSLNINGI